MTNKRITYYVWRNHSTSRVFSVGRPFTRRRETRTGAFSKRRDDDNSAAVRHATDFIVSRTDRRLSTSPRTTRDDDDGGGGGGYTRIWPHAGRDQSDNGRTKMASLNQLYTSSFRLGGLTPPPRVRPHRTVQQQQ